MVGVGMVLVGRILDAVVDSSVDDMEEGEGGE